MGGKPDSLGEDQFTTRVILEFMLIIIGLAVLAFLTINTTLWQTAQTFWVFGLMGLLGVIVAFVVKNRKGSDGFNVPLAEDKNPLNINKKWLYLAFIAVFILTFFILSVTKYSISAPDFQVVDLGLQGNILLTAFSAIMEDIFFFVLVPGLIFSLVYLLSKNFYLAIALVLILNPFTFMIYHLAVYGFSDQAGMFFVYAFGFEMTIMMLVVRDVLYCHVRHVGNNLGLLVFKQMSFGTFIVMLITSIWFWAAVAIIALIIYSRYRGR